MPNASSSLLVEAGESLADVLLSICATLDPARVCVSGWPVAYRDFKNAFEHEWAGSAYWSSAILEYYPSTWQLASRGLGLLAGAI